MQAVSNTGRSGVLVLKVDEDDVNTVLMNTDIENDGSLKYAYDNFADAFSENILEYAFAYADIPRKQITKKQREAAQSLLKLHEIEKLRYYLEHDVPEEDWEPAFLRWYEKKGVLGEIVLHMFLKEFKNTIPLISKMYFKDSFSQEAKGFDAVHVSQDSLTLWLGETKFYKAWKTKGVVKGGIDELVEDLKKHITKDYLSEQYVIIKRGLETQLEHPQREEWIEKLSRPIIQPTLALLDETRIKLKRYFDQYKVIVRTSQSASTEKGNIFLLTAERVLEYPDMPDIELLIIDEFYKLSKQREDNRANILNIAFLRLMKNPSCRFYLLGPNIDNISPGFLEKYNAVFYKTDYSLVYTETEDLYDTVKKKPGGKVSYEDIFAVLDATEDQSLIFCSSPSTARKLAFAYSNHLEAQGNEQNTDIPLIQWINENLGVEWSLAHCLSNGIGIHDGSMPKHITVSTIKYFNDQKLKFLFCTNTIIEGVNTSAKNVIYYDSKIGTRDVDYFDYANIRGRAGRLMEHCVGRVINLKKPPQAKEMSVDIPAYTQNPIDDEVLVNIEKAEVKPFNMERYQRFENLPEELKIILKRNAVSIKDQLELLPIIRAMLIDPHRRGDIVWSELRDRNLYNHLCIIFDLVKDRFVEGNDKNVLISTKWMATQTVSYIYSKNIRQMIVERVAYRAKEYLGKNVPNSADMHFSSQQFLVEYPEMARQFADEAVETIFRFQKNWLQYKIPKWLNVVDSLQKYIAAELGMEAGDYSFIAEAIENEFTAANIQILTEFGIPSSAIRKILDRYGHHLKGLTEDQVVAAIIRNRELINRCLSVYEIEALEMCL